MIALILGVIIYLIGFNFYLAHFREQVRETDVNAAQQTVSYATNLIRDKVISAGGGLPMSTSGIVGNSGNHLLCAYNNPTNNFASFDAVNNHAKKDGRLPVDTIDIFDGASYVYVVGNGDTLLKITQIHVQNKWIKVDPKIDEDVFAPQYLYPVMMQCIYLDADSLKMDTTQTPSPSGVPLAIHIDTLQVSFDCSRNGNGTFTNSVNSGQIISRVKVYVVARGRQTASGVVVSRRLETTIGIRRGRI